MRCTLISFGAAGFRGPWTGSFLGSTHVTKLLCCLVSLTFLRSASKVCPLLAMTACLLVGRFLHHTRSIRGSFERCLWRGRGISGSSSLKHHSSSASFPLRLCIPIQGCHFIPDKWWTYSWPLVFLRPFESFRESEWRKGKRGWFICGDASIWPKLFRILRMCLFLCLIRRSKPKNFLLLSLAYKNFLTFRSWRLRFLWLGDRRLQPS